MDTQFRCMSGTKNSWGEESFVSQPMTRHVMDALKILANDAGLKLDDYIAVHSACCMVPQLVCETVAELRRRGGVLSGALSIQCRGGVPRRVVVSNKAPDGVCLYPPQERTFGRERSE